MKTSFHQNTIQKNSCIFSNNKSLKFVQSLTVWGLLAVSSSSLRAIVLNPTDDVDSSAFRFVEVTNTLSSLDAQRADGTQVVLNRVYKGRAASAPKLELGGANNSKVFLKFDLSALPPIPSELLLPSRDGARKSFVATLRVYVTAQRRLSTGLKVKSAADNPSSAWSETDTNILPLTIPMTNFVTAEYVNKYGDGDFLEYNVTEIVKGWLSGKPNNGLALSIDSTDKLTINSKEADGHAAQLIIDFEPGAGVEKGDVELDDLPIAPAAQISRTSFAVLLGSSSIVNFNPTPDVDTAGLFSASQPEYLTVRHPGVYEFNVTVKWDTTGLSSRIDDSLRVDLVKMTAAGPQVVASDITDPSGGVSYSRLHILQQANANDSFAVQVSQNANPASPVNIDITVSTKIIAILAAQ